MDQSGSNSTSAVDSGVSSLIKRRKISKKNTKEDIIDTMCRQVATFGGLVLYMLSKPKSTESDYGRIYRLYKTSLKAEILLETECRELDEELEPLPIHAENLLKSDDSVKLWSEFFFKKSSPTKIRHVKTIVSPTTEQIGGLLHSIGSFIGLTAEAACSSKRNKENIENIQHLLVMAKNTIALMKRHSDDLAKKIESFMKQKAAEAHDANPGKSD